MSNRGAIDTIRGYVYQFDLSILELLKRSCGSDSVDIEMIEDVDINTATETTAIQCKYYSKTEYNHSVISLPIRLMLSNYKKRKDKGLSPVRYKIYGKYESGQDKLTLPIDAEFLKTHFLTYKKEKKEHFHHTELGITDLALNDFLGLLTIDINAKTYEEQFQNVLDKIKSCFICSDFEAEHYYYNNALNVVLSLSLKANDVDRRITKDGFLSQINKKNILFNTWFVELKGRKEYIKGIKQQLFTLTLNTSPFERFFLIEVPNIDYDRAKLKTLILSIQKKWSKLSKRDTQPFCPYVFLHHISDQELLGIKINLRDEGHSCIDGFDFQNAEFSAKSIGRQATYHSEIKLKIINELDQVNLVLGAITKTKEVYQFYLHDPFFETESPAIKHVKIQIKTLHDIEEITK
ncbi:MAG TPA: DUF4297 family anti-phage-associated protein [Candidatus Wunengus sp. YC61]|uniref:DUF4297 family anti-phage-associated protein n=1 Tax=Candidatus Wunengus sp. YC61 TaxID=3367698 RepID=UPI004029F740